MNEWEELRQIVAANAKAIQALTEESREIKQFINSNAKVISILTNDNIEEKKERQRNDRKLYDAMAKMSDAIAIIASAQAKVWEVQAEHYRRLEQVDERQTQIIEILDRLSDTIVNLS